MIDCLNDMLTQKGQFVKTVREGNWLKGLRIVLVLSYISNDKIRK